MAKFYSSLEEVKPKKKSQTSNGVGAKAKSTVSKNTGIGAKVKTTVKAKTGLGAKAKTTAAKKVTPSMATNAYKTAAMTKPKPVVKTPAVKMSATTKGVPTAKPATTAKPKASSSKTTTSTSTAKKTTVPYLTDKQIRSNYDNYYNQYATQMQKEASRANAQTNAQHDTQQRSNYINYMEDKKELPRQLAEQGITGGMSETSALRTRTNYENRLGNIEKSRQSDLGDIQNKLSDNLATYKMTADQNMNDEIANNRQLRSEYEQKEQQRTEERYANNIAGFRTVAQINKAIETAKKNGENWKIPYLNNRKTAILEQAESKKGAEKEATEQRFVNTIGRYDTVKKCNDAIKEAKKNGETWKIPYLSQQKSTLKTQGKTEKQAEQERKEQRFVNNIGGYDTVEKCNNAIATAKKKGETWKIPYLRQQKANIKKEGKTEKQARTERYEQRYANTISGWNSVDSINKEIKKIQKSGKNTWRIAYLRARRTELLNAGEAGTGTGSGSSGGSSGGGKSSGKSSGGSSGGGGANTPKEETTQKENKKPKVNIPSIGGDNDGKRKSGGHRAKNPKKPVGSKGVSFITKEKTTTKKKGTSKVKKSYQRSYTVNRKTGRRRTEWVK